METAVEVTPSMLEEKCGHLFAVPLIDGSHALGHVALVDTTAVAAFFDHRSGNPEGLFEGIDEALKARPIAILSFVAIEPWPIIAEETPAYPAFMLETQKTYQAADVRQFLSIHFGLLKPSEAELAVPYNDMLLPAHDLAREGTSAQVHKTSGKQGVSGSSGSASTRRKRIKVRTGQIVAVPLSDGSFALVHVALRRGGIYVAHFDHRAPTLEALVSGMNDALRKRPIAILQVTDDEIEDGHWPVVGHEVPRYPASMLDQKRTSHTANVTPWLFAAYYGLRPWDETHDPRYVEKLLLPGVPIPPTVRYKRDFENDASRVASPASSDVARMEPIEASVEDGPAEIHIQIKYEGDGLPSVALLRRRQALEKAIAEAGAGDVTDAGGGGGVMDIYVRTEDVRRSLPLVAAAVKRSGFEADVTITGTAPSDL